MLDLYEIKDEYPDPIDDSGMILIAPITLEDYKLLTKFGVLNEEIKFFEDFRISSTMVVQLHKITQDKYIKLSLTSGFNSKELTVWKSMLETVNSNVSGIFGFCD